MPKSETSVAINVTVNQRDKAISDEIKRRAEQLGPMWSLSAYGLEIWKWWHQQGCPPVNVQDNAMIVANQMTAAKKSQKRAEQHPQQAGQRNDRP